jgi:chromosome segregation ATPase
LKAQLSEKNLSYERLKLEKQDIERRVGKDRDDVDRVKSSYEYEMTHLKEQSIKLTEKLSNTEARLASAEKESKNARQNIDERQKQIDELKDQLSKTKSELMLQLNLSKREKEEKEILLKKMDQMEETIRKNMQQVSDLKVGGRRMDDDGEEFERNRSAPNSARNLELADPRVTQIENENRRLQSDVKDLNEKLYKTEIELEKVKNSGLKVAQSSPTMNGGSMLRSRNQEDFETRNVNGMMANNRSASALTENDKLKVKIKLSRLFKL